MKSSALILIISIVSFVSGDSPSDDEVIPWGEFDENGTFVTRDWRKSLTTKLEFSSTERPYIKSSIPPQPTERHIPTTTTPPTTTHKTTTRGKLITRRPTGVTESTTRQGGRVADPQVIDLDENAAPSVRVSTALIVTLAVFLVSYGLY